MIQRHWVEAESGTEGDDDTTVNNQVRGGAFHTFFCTFILYYIQYSIQKSKTSPERDMNRR